MVNHVARLAILHHSPFQTIFQEAAARAYSRVQTSRSPINVLRAGPSTEISSRDSHVPIIPIPNRRPLCWRFCSNLIVQRRHYSSRAPAVSAPLLPVFSAVPSLRLKGDSKKRPFINQKGQQYQSPHPVLRDTAGGASLPNSQVDFLDQAPSSSTALEDNSVPTPLDLRSTSQPSVTISSAHGRNDSLSRQLHHLYLSSPHTSIQSLVLYHNSFPDLQSTRSYNLLLRLSIRHSAFGTAHTLLQSMRASRVPEDLTTWKLSVRLLVREGRWLDAHNLVVDLPKNLSSAPFASDGVPVHVWAELLGTVKRRAFQGTTQMRDPGMYNLARYRHVMRQLPKLGISSKDTPPPQVVYASVAALLRMQQRGAAQQVTTQFLTVDPNGLGLRLVHLHVAAEPRRHTLATFYRALRDLRGFRAVCPKLKPNSITLFLLLGHLKGVKQCGIIGHKFVQWFRRRWGNSVVSPRVERRLLALAVKEKRVDLIKQWMTCVNTRRKIWWMWSLEREVVDGGIPKRRSLSRHPDLRLARAGTERLYVDRLLRRASRVLSLTEDAKIT
ncbi:hypothetical protein BJV78DRAFT_1163040 [Lactifluus subvellereus]|nr:hypothetical protein BJV78DRAFT_1163040 [Lactifluus subvellereus]